MPHFDFSGLSLEVFLFPKILRAQNLLFRFVSKLWAVIFSSSKPL